MNAREFFDLVSKMRQAQTAFFKTKAPGTLHESKRLERLVDDEINRVNGIINREPSLFDNSHESK